MLAASRTTLIGFTAEAVAHAAPGRRVMAVFNAVSRLPYATDTAHTAAELLQQGSGNCAAKSDLLVQALDLVGVRSRLVRWLYRLPAITDLSELPSQLDLHTAVQVRDGDRWLLADPTIDEGLRGLLPVASWELSRHSTTAFCPRSAVWVIPDDQRQVGAASEAVAAAWSRGDTARHQRTAARYRRAFNEALRHHRTMTSAGSPPTSG